jgi:hypothetical protein
MSEEWENINTAIIESAKRNNSVTRKVSKEWMVG